MTHSPGGRAHHREIDRLRAIIAAQDARILRMQQQHADTIAEVTRLLNRWMESDRIREAHR